MSNDDGHSPKTCNYNECKADSDTVCPFLADDKQPKQPGSSDCQHEWRPIPLYCIHCMEIREMQMLHNMSANRGQSYPQVPLDKHWTPFD